MDKFRIPTKSILDQKPYLFETNTAEIRLIARTSSFRLSISLFLVCLTVHFDRISQ